MGIVFRFIARILGFVLKTIGSGATPLVLIGFLLWVFDSFFARMDEAAWRIFSGLLSNFLLVNLEHAGLGTVLLLFIAFILGLPFLPGKKRLSDYLSFGKIIGLIAKNKFRHMPLVEIHVRTIIERCSDGTLQYLPVLEKGFLDVTRQWITKKDGSKEEFVSYAAFIPTANNPTSGRLQRFQPEAIKFILDNSTGQLFFHIFTFGRAGNTWNRREFDPSEFLPHDPD